MKKFHDYFDDSSSSEDEEKISSSLTGEYIDHITRITNEKKLDAIKNVFLLHDLGNRILHSQPVREFYYNNLKPKYLKNNNYIITANQLEELLLKFVEQRPEYLDKKFITKIMQNLRQLMQNLTQQDIYFGEKEYSDLYLETALKDLEQKTSPFKSKFSKSTLGTLEGNESLFPLTKIIAAKLIDSISWSGQKVKPETEPKDSKVKYPKQELKSFEETTKLLVEENLAVDCLAQELNNFLKETSKITESPYLRKTLKNKFTFDYEIGDAGEYTATKFLANIKLIHRSLKREMKNIGTWTEETHDSIKTSYSYKFPKKDFTEDKLFTEEHEVSSTTRQSVVKSLGKYKKVKQSEEKVKKDKNKDIVEEIEAIKTAETIDDPAVARALLDIIRTGTQSIITDNSKLYHIAYLLFGCEVNRNSASLLTNAMFLDLIAAHYKSKEYEYSFSSLPGLDDKDDNLNSGLPMAMRGAVDAMRRFNHLYKKYLSSKFTYDYEDAGTAFKITAPLGILLAREAKVLKDWLEFKGSIKEEENIDLKKIIPTLIEAIDKWYGINLNYLLTEPTMETEENKKEEDQKIDYGCYSKLQLQEELQNALALIKLNSKDDTSSIAPQVKSVLGKVQQFIKGNTQNAFNQRDNKNYQYQATDVVVIQNQMMKDYQKDFTINQPIGDAKEINKFLEGLLKNLNNDKPSLCVYNIGNYHWIIFAAIQYANGITILYKDSLGSSNDDLQEKIKGVNKDIKFIHNKNKEQTQGLECGIFALKNMQIMAEQLHLDKDNFIKNFIEFKDFCTLKQAQEFRQNEFPKQYVLGKCEEIRQADANLNKSYAVREHHFSEVDALISEILSKSEKLAGLTIQVLKPSVNLNTEVEQSIITIEIGIDSLDEHNNYDYSYRIYLTNNIIDKANDVIEALKITIGDYILKNNEITISSKKLTTLITQKEKIKIGEMVIPEYEIKIEELYDTLSTLNEQGKNKVKEIIALKGLEAQEDIDINWINSYFGKYTLDGLDNILDLRLKELKLKDIKTLKGIFIDHEHNNIAELVSNIINTKVQTILVPFNLFNKHAAGLIFEKAEDNSIQVKYLDPENNPLSSQLEQIFRNHNLNIEQLKVEQQKYANCGPEVIENFILYLTGTRISQEKTIELHSKLVENALLGIDSSGIHLSFEELVDAKCTGSLEEKTKYTYSYQSHNFDYEKQLGGDLIFVNLDE